MEKMNNEEFNNVSGGILGPRSAEAMSRYEACIKAKESMPEEYFEDFDWRREKRRLRVKASMAYDKGLAAQMSGTAQELDEKDINSLNNYSDSMFNAIKGHFKDIK